jgi:MFS family permease
MSSATRSIFTLLIGAAALVQGNGLLSTLVPIRAQMEAFSESWIGALGGIYFAGFALGCLVGPKVVMRVGHVRCFAGFAALSAVAVLIHTLSVDIYVWAFIRGITGFCFAVLFMVIESWLNDQTRNEVRGSVLSIYIIVANLATLAGQLAVNLYDPLLPALFVLAAIAISLSLVPIVLTDTAVPKPLASANLRIGPLFKLSPTAFVGCFTVGIVEGAFWTLGPVFGQGRDLTISQITIFMGAFMVGGTISQWPVGRLSDHLDRRYVLGGCCLATVASGLLLALYEPSSAWIVVALACLHGAVMIPLYALCLAHANDLAPNDKLVEVSSGLLLIYAGGAVLGPLAIGPAMEHLGIGALFLAMALILGLFSLFIGYRALRRPIAAAVERVHFFPVPKTTPSVYALESEDEERPNQ